MEASEARGLACMEVWGGNGRVKQALDLPGLAGWVYSEPYNGSDTGGDVYYLSACSRGQLARVCLADVSGHGPTVGEMAECLRDLMSKHVNTFDQSDFARELNRAFAGVVRAGRFATVALFGLASDTGELVVTNAGQPAPLWYRANVRRWELLGGDVAADAADIGLPLGLIDGTNYLQTAVRLLPGDLLAIYTDALTEAKSPVGEMLENEGLLKLAADLPVDLPAAAGQELLKAVEHYRGGAPASDDQTLVVLQRLGA